MIYAVAKLEFSVDPLSDTTPAWTDITRYCQGMSWFGGVSKDTDGPQAGGATFVLKNLQRRFEPEYTAGAYYPNIVPGRRFRVTVTADGVARAQGIYYAREWKVEYPDPSLGYSTVTVACSDGFWRLAQDVAASLSPASAESYADVVASDNPFAYYRMDDIGGKKLNPDTGPDGVYRGYVDLSVPSPVLGDPGHAAMFTGPPVSQARAKLDDEDIFQDANAFTIEVVVTNNIGAATAAALAYGPANATGATLSLNGNSVDAIVGTSTFITASSSNTPTGTHHVAGTFDGGLLTFYRDGVQLAQTLVSASLAGANAGEYLYVPSASPSGGTDNLVIGHVAFYNYALTAGQVANHSTMALSRGYPAATSGTRIATLATDPLWSTAGIPAGTVTVEATPQHGQAVIDEITAAQSTEAPGSIFYFNDAGNPAYETLLDTWTPAATFGDTPSEINYDQLDLAYDDDLFNTATVSGPGLVGATASDSQSLSDYGNRGIDQSSLPIVYQSDAALLAQTYVDRFSSPAFRVESISLNGSSQSARTQILTREIGDCIRVKRRGDGGVAIDIITRILGKEKSLDVNGDLRCTWSLARGFNASLAQWHLNTTGFGELGQTTTLA